MLCFLGTYMYNYNILYIHILKTRNIVIFCSPCVGGLLPVLAQQRAGQLWRVHCGSSGRGETGRLCPENAQRSGAQGLLEKRVYNVLLELYLNIHD